MIFKDINLDLCLCGL